MLIIRAYFLFTGKHPPLSTFPYNSSVHSVSVVHAEFAGRRFEGCCPLPVCTTNVKSTERRIKLNCQTQASCYMLLLLSFMRSFPIPIHHIFKPSRSPSGRTVPFFVVPVLLLNYHDYRFHWAPFYSFSLFSVLFSLIWFDSCICSFVPCVCDIVKFCWSWSAAKLLIASSQQLAKLHTHSQTFLWSDCEWYF